MADLKALRIVILDNLCISRPAIRRHLGAPLQKESEQAYATDVQDTAPKIIEFDLSRNLFENWDEIVDICRQLRSLRSLKVDGNKFRSINEPHSNPSLKLEPFTMLQSLSLDNTLLSWNQVSFVSK